MLPKDLIHPHRASAARSFVPPRRMSLAFMAAIALATGCRDGLEPIVEPPAQPSLASSTLVFTQISAGHGAHTCGVTATAAAFCWGTNFLGQLGDGSLVDRHAPVPVAGGLQFRVVSAGNGHSCGVTTDSRAYCWGDNQYGRLGDGSMVSRLTPVRVAGGLAFRQVSVGLAHTCGLTTDNRVYCWGSNRDGELGDGSTIDRVRPVEIAGDRRYRQISAGGGHTCAIATSDQAFCWGSNTSGQLGIGSTIARRLRPTPVAGTLAFSQISASYINTCATTTGSRAYCWGSGVHGEIGDGLTRDRRTPRAVAGSFAFDRVTAGPSHACAETVGNRAYCWGLNLHGALGDPGGDQIIATPMPVAGGLIFRQLSAGNGFTCGKTGTGAVYCWGYNIFGQLGDGTTIDRLTPVQVGNGT
jgi:alpha-tubulin suppressor-like RCC1 family protein